MAFSKIITNGWLVYEMKLFFLMVLPFVSMAIEISPNVFSFGKYL